MSSGRDTQIVVRCSVEERSSFREAAKTRGLSISDYVRWLHGLALVRRRKK